MGAVYERELKGILGGEAKTLRQCGLTLGPAEKSAYESTLNRPFLVVRAAGSLGADLVAVRSEISFLVEVKSTKSDTLYLAGAPRLAAQSAEIRFQCERAGVLPIYALRQKGVRGDAWRLFTMPDMNFDGRTRLLWNHVPKIPKSSRGNDVLRWEAGMPLARFLQYVNEVFGRTPQAAVLVPRTS